MELTKEYEKLLAEWQMTERAIYLGGKYDDGPAVPVRIYRGAGTQGPAVIYCHAGAFVLGNLDTVAPVDGEVLALVASRFKRELSASTVDNSDTPTLGLPASTIEHALASVPHDLDYDAWVHVGMALHHETNGDGFETWDAWSQQSPKYTSRSYGLERWNSFGKRDRKSVV